MFAACVHAQANASRSNTSIWVRVAEVLRATRLTFDLHLALPLGVPKSGQRHPKNSLEQTRSSHERLVSSAVHLLTNPHGVLQSWRHKKNSKSTQGAAKN